MMEAFYKGYFQNLVSVSTHLQAFFYINDRYNLDAFDNAVKSLTVSPGLLLEQYDYGTEDYGTRNYMKEIQGQFNILFKTDQGNQSTVESSRILGEQFADMVIARMRSDFAGGAKITLKDGTASGTVFFKKVKAKVQAIGPINANYYGVACAFTWETPFVVPVLSDDWTDVNP